MSKISYIEEMAIVGMLKSEKNIQEIRKETGYSQCTVSRIAKKHGIKPTRSYVKITPEIIQKVMAADRTGKARSEIAKELMIGTSTVNNIIRKQKSSGNERSDLDENKEIQLNLDPTPPTPPHKDGHDLKDRNDPFDMMQNALKEINDAIELIKGMYYGQELF